MEANAFTRKIASLYHEKPFSVDSGRKQKYFTVAYSHTWMPEDDIIREYPFEVILIQSSFSWTLGALSEAATAFLEQCKIPYHALQIILNVEKVYSDGELSFDKTAALLKAFLEASRLKVFKTPGRFQRMKRSHYSKPPRRIILADALGSYMAKGVALKCFLKIPANTELMLLFEEINEPQPDEDIRDDDIRQEIDKTFRKVTDEFNHLLLKNDNPGLFPKVWKATIRPGLVGDDSADSELRQTFPWLLEEAVSRFYFEMDIGFAQQELSSMTSTLRLENYKALQERHVSETQKKQSDFSKPDLQLNPPIKSSHDDGWKDLRDQAEACLEVGDNQRAFAMFQACLAMRIPYDGTAWEIKSSLEFARMILGQYVQAEHELDQLRREVEGYIERDSKAIVTDIFSKSLSDIYRTILLNHALALSRLGKYYDIELCLNNITLRGEPDLPPENPTREEQGYYIFSAAVFRLRALALAHQELHNSAKINDALASADRWCEKLGDVKSAEPVRISNIVNRCRISALRGHYAEALTLLRPALVKAIAEIGETNILTIEAALLFSSLQIETGQFRQGRLTCERCANVIEDNFGNDHPLVLEAEHILISASHQEGLLLNALDDSISLHRRAESSVQLGHKHPSVLRYKSQLWEIRMECGQYSSAESILKEILQLAEYIWHSKDREITHPEVARIQSQLALAQYRAGKLSLAENTILAALRKQCSIYLRLDENDPWFKDGNSKINWRYVELTGLLRVIGGAFTGKDSESVTHPDILRSLLTCARILSSSSSADMDLVFHILQLVRDVGKAKLGGSHLLPLTAALTTGEALSAMAMVESDEERRQDLYRRAMSSFDFVMEQKDEPLPFTKDFMSILDSYDKGSLSAVGRKNEFGDPAVVHPVSNIQSGETSKDEASHYKTNRGSRIRGFMMEHPVVLSTRQERILACLLFSESEVEIGNVLDRRDELNDVLTAQRIRPGQSHHQTAKTLTTLLTLELSFPEPSEQVTKIYKEIVVPLGRDDVEHERFLECLLLRERVARILGSRPYLLEDEYRNLLEDIKGQIEEGQEMKDPSIRTAVGLVKKRTEDMLRDV